MRKAANVIPPGRLPREARHRDVNVSHACEQGLPAAVSEARAAAWLRENRAALDAWNEYVEQHGPPLSEFRQF